MEFLSWPLAIFLAYAPMLFGLVFVIAAGILFMRVRSAACGMFFFGLLVTTFAPWAFRIFGGTAYSRGADSIGRLVMVAAVAVQIVGFLFYVLSLPKKSSDK